jgi:hypothetical protein
VRRSVVVQCLTISHELSLRRFGDSGILAFLPTAGISARTLADSILPIAKRDGRAPREMLLPSSRATALLYTRRGPTYCIVPVFRVRPV